MSSVTSRQLVANKLATSPTSPRGSYGEVTDKSCRVVSLQWKFGYTALVAAAQLWVVFRLLLPLHTGRCAGGVLSNRKHYLQILPIFYAWNKSTHKICLKFCAWRVCGVLWVVLIHPKIWVKNFARTVLAENALSTPTDDTTYTWPKVKNTNTHQ